MTNLLRMTLVALACALGGGAVLAQDVLKRIAARKQVNVGYSVDSAPFSFVAQGRPTGYSIDLCVHVLERLGREVGQPNLAIQVLPVEQDQLPRLVRTGAVDLVCGGVSDTPQRRQSMSFSAPIYLSAVKLLVRSDGPKAATDLKGATVAVLGRTTAEAAVSQLSEQRGLALKVARVVSAEAALSRMRLRHADAWARDEVLLLGTLAREGDAASFTLLHDVLSSEVIALAMPRDAEMQRVVNEALADVVRSGRIDALYEQWFVQPNTASAAGLKLPMSPALRAEFDRLR